MDSDTVAAHRLVAADTDGALGSGHEVHASVMRPRVPSIIQLQDRPGVGASG
ncbi:MAG TPA: hypothetical protein VER39_06060 [Nocardioidaceae bacterium]|nr:hypothetical protein [Nocardioidaceae bacterium]